MARTIGAKSLKAIKFNDLKKIVGEGFTGTIVVGTTWLESVSIPADVRLVKVPAKKAKS